MEKEEKRLFSSQRGITLVALIITIIVLLILAGVTITMIVGDNGILNKAKLAGEKQKEANTRERLELELENLKIDESTNSGYNKDDYLTDYLENEGMIVAGDEVIFDGYSFEINRDELTITEFLGRCSEISDEDIKVDVSSESAEDFKKSTIKIEIQYAGTVKKVTINGEEQIIGEKAEDNKYTIQKVVTKNGKYKILIKDEKGNYKIKSIEIEDLEDYLPIQTAEDFAKFRDAVNKKGKTFEGREIKLANDIDLSSVCGQNTGSWEPIGKGNNLFKGTFDGQYHKIKNLYINSSDYQYAGLFMQTTANSKIQNCILENVYINNTYSVQGSNCYAAGLSVRNDGTISNCAVVSGTIIADQKSSVNKNWTEGLSGGIVGCNYGTIDGCYNNAEICRTCKFC